MSLLQVVEIDESEFKQKRRGQGWRNQTYDNREFVAWDGEGWTDHRIECPSRSSQENCDGGCPHHYCLFGSSKGGGVASPSLSTKQCLDHILDIGNQYPKAIHIGFAFSYDVNMILRDLSPKALKILKDTTFVHWRGYRIEHIPKKWLIVAKGKISVQIQDVFSFFACSFVKALTQWKVGTPDDIAQISEGKDSRSNFRFSDVENHIRPYWEKELSLLVDLGQSLRSILYSAGLRITGWYGPGNIASFLYKKHGTKETMDRELPKEVIEAAAYAYAGGRFEGFKAGQHLGPVYSADINSAYPAAMAELPDLRTGRWSYHKSWSADLGVPSRLGLYHVFFCFDSRISSAARLHGFPLPLFHRRHSGQVWYPDMSEGWYHAPEIRILLKIHEESGGKAFSHFEIKEAWIYEDDGSYPFQWVQEMYDQRAVWKREGKPAQLALKLGINSLYGKLAQRIGSKDGEVPTWHQLEWAGLITSHTRAMLYEAMRDDWEHVISVETDGIYSTVPLSGIQGNCGSGLGQWETAEYTGIVFLQNGVYWLRDHQGDWLPPKSRGIPQRQLSRTAAISALEQKSDLVAHQQMFMGYGIALHRSDMDIWRRWVHAEKRFEFGGNGKRFHDATTCPQCNHGLGWDESLHTLSLRLPHPGVDRIMSSKHHLPWWDEMYDGVETLKHELRWQITEH